MYSLQMLADVNFYSGGPDMTSLVISIVGTLIAIASFFISLFKWQIRPKLVLSQYKSDDPNYHGEISQLSSGAPAVFYHLEVLNTRGHIHAKETTVVIRSIWRKSDNKWTEWNIAKNLRMTWQHFRDNPDQIGRSVGATPQIVDLAVITSEGVFLMMADSCRPRIFPGQLTPNEPLILELKALSQETESNSLYLFVQWDGTKLKNQTPEQISSHLIFKYDKTLAGIKSKALPKLLATGNFSALDN